MEAVEARFVEITKAYKSYGDICVNFRAVIDFICPD